MSDVEFYVAGRRYLGGVGRPEREEPYYGVWDIRTPGPAVERFPATDEGWNDLARWLSRREPNIVPLRPDIECPTCHAHLVTRISGADKAVTVAAVGLFALGKLGKTFHCLSCGYRW